MSDSTKRRRSVLLQCWTTPAEAVIVQHKAAATSTSVSEILRAGGIGYRVPKAKIDREIAHQLLAAMQDAKGGWGQFWSNVKQIAKEVNMGRTPRLASLESEVQELKDRVERDFSEFRTLLMQALGEERKRKPRDK